MMYPKDGPKVALRTMETNGTSTLFVVDSDRMLKGIVHVDDMAKLEKKNERSIKSKLVENVYLTSPDTSIAELLPIALVSNYPVAVTDANNRLLGVVDRASIIAEVGGQADEILPTELNPE
jgi:glycine betaine/proline transport system ATP-binding protein